jgi:SAM-dependent methyltransferase
MAIMNPVSPEGVDELVEAIDLRSGARVLDLGCGKGELLVRLAERFGADGVGVDLQGALLAEGRALAAARAPDRDLRFVEADVTAFVPERPEFDLAATVGATPDSYRATLGRLRDLVRPGGLVLLGEGYWRREPSDEYLAALGASRDELTDYAGTIRAGEEEGLTPLYAVVSSAADFDRYEWRWSLNGERYASEHPDEPGIDDFLAWIRNGRRRYVELGGRDTLGFGLFLFRRPG